uniref:G_PROTEIN_RECEP_F1_2 domain-containing protein n=1 Tax=Caenorhabditis tropicalis TaxID=1561998 RepID=A0A1I7V2T3_9PELO
MSCPYNRGFQVISLILLLIPYFSSCPVNINQRTFRFAVDCDTRHPITQFENDWLFLIPVFTLCLNVGLILYLAQKRGEALRRRRLNVVSISSTSNVHLPPLVNTKSKIRQAYEYSLLLQSILTTVFLSIYELTGLMLRLFAKEYQTVSLIAQQLVFYIRLSFSSLLCFLVFFIGSPPIRKLIIEKVKGILKGKVVVRSPTNTVLV